MPTLRRSAGEQLMATGKENKPEKGTGKKKPAPAGGVSGEKSAKAAAKPKAPAQPEAVPEEKVPARLWLRYQAEIVPALMRELKLENRLAVPRLEKIVINIGLGEARDNIKLLDTAIAELAQIAGQRPVVTRARKAISNFKIRKGMPIGAMVTLRGQRMYEFFDRLVTIALPRVRDFRGVSEKAFDGRGDYSLGIREHTIFPELDLEKVERVKGLTISFVTTARSDYEGFWLLKLLGMPFRGPLPERESVAA
jgi:large subunit ribosomal protein L5